MRLLTGLLRNNRKVQELDLSATMLQKECATTLLETVLAGPEPSVQTIHLTFNPSIDEACQQALRGALELSKLKMELNF